MNKNKEVIKKFYSSFQNKDSKSMIKCYHDQIEFNDPVFSNLKGIQAKAMWQMLVERGKDLHVTFENIQADDEHGSADWVAVYTFSKTGRKVQNKIHAEFRFKDNKIIWHQDDFDLWKWAGMALGPIGMILGFTSFVQNKIRNEAKTALEAFIKKHNLH